MDEPHYLAVSTHGEGPGVLVLHAWWGLNDTFKGVCDRLAKAGFVALAPDLYDGEIAHTQKEALQLKRKHKAADIRKLINSAMRALVEHPTVDQPLIGVVGFSLGGFYALGLANQKPRSIAAVVTFYGGGGSKFDKSRAAFQGHFAEDDPFESSEGIANLEAILRTANRPVDFYMYPGTKHWFFEPDRPEYDPAAADLAWERTINFLREKL